MLYTIIPNIQRRTLEKNILDPALISIVTKQRQINMRRERKENKKPKKGVT
jgi:hypothetical protein